VSVCFHVFAVAVKETSRYFAKKNNEQCGRKNGTKQQQGSPTALIANLVGIFRLRNCRLCWVTTRLASSTLPLSTPFHSHSIPKFTSKESFQKVLRCSRSFAYFCLLFREKRDRLNFIFFFS